MCAQILVGISIRPSLVLLVAKLMIWKQTRWFKNCLKSRVQCVTFKRFVSDAIDVSSEVPQGAHLAPILFVIFISVYSVFKDVECVANDIKLGVSRALVE